MPINRQIVVPLLVIVMYVLGCGMFSGKGGDAELVFPATKVGTPEGEEITKQIGPAGGTLSSPDGRVTLTVPPNALAETIMFSIQPITNKAQKTDGPASRFGPDAKTFSTPLEITLKYDEDDRKGTVPEALLLAYQNPQGEWRQLKSKKFDPKNNTISVETTHFTDVGLLARLRINPTSATVYVGESLGIEFIQCRQLNLIERLRGVHWREPCSQYLKVDWGLTGPGKLSDVFGEPGTPAGLLYTAPATKPTDNNAYVDVEVELDLQDPTTGELSRVKRKFRSVITIIGRGYTASGQDGQVVYSGTICDLSKPFTVTGTHPIFLYPFKFLPSSETAGTMSFKTRRRGIETYGSGPYKIEGRETDTPRIVVNSMSTASIPVITTSGGGTATIDLVPLETDGCE